ncbi:hypothetical protein CHH28_13055 [Bacterioplanes sanyensis]|uniref:Sensory/regulatory protein RpfC n=1 Tax=Bacterioplanes sanyensis TaxID=1249553 RepID=A0A222FLS6_9GAMM|nr:ATP-binding protein [Bacterioplanes sanyensis]ASP39546.1 hypothetical protein CHH28_13055 [Bacterioplanes sanyensis]
MSLKQQILLLLAAIVVSLMVQIVLSQFSQHSLRQANRHTSDVFNAAQKISALERQVLDLQRNVLIFRQNASDSAATRFFNILTDVFAQIERMEASVQFQSHSTDIVRMTAHIQDYGDHFRAVVNGREQQDSLQQVIIEQQLGQLRQRLQSQPGAADAALADILRGHLLSYLVAYDHRAAERFIDQTSQFNRAANTDLKPLLEGLHTNFLKLQQINRGYVYLTNVVMTGAANEILYITRQLREHTSAQLHTATQQALLSSDRIRTTNLATSTAGVALTLLAAWLLLRMILSPIRRLTETFDRLAKGDPIEAPTDIHRHDEIGALARAAMVFRQKNEQTHTLLQQAQQLNQRLSSMNEQLESARAQAETATTMKSAFLANMSHEIRTPMNGIIGLIDLSLKTALTEKQRFYLQKAAYSSQLMMAVINDILDFSKIEAGKLDICPVEMDVNNLAEHVITSLLPKAREKSLALRLHVEANLPKTIDADPLRLNQILLNLGNNAIKFTNSGSVDVRFSTEHDTLIFEVIDSGIGMSPEQLERVFDAFTQADSSISRRHGGTGLGLSIVKQLTELMDGHIDVQSALHKGTHFRIRLPLKRHSSEPILRLSKPKSINLIGQFDSDMIPHGVFQQAQILDIEEITSAELSAVTLIHVSSLEQYSQLQDWLQQQQQQQPPNCPCGLIMDHPWHRQLPIAEPIKVLLHPYSPAAFAQFIDALLGHSVTPEAEVDTPSLQLQGRVLVVEDNHINQVVATSMLDELGLHYDLAENGEEAVAMVNIHPYDMVLMDIQMPIMDGYEATQLIRQMGNTTLPIYAMSANAHQRDIDRALQAGMNGYLVKPVEFQQLSQLLSLHLATPQHSA